jgi:L-fuconolactonase
VLRLAADYAPWWHQAQRLARQLHPAPAAADLDALFGGNAAAFYRLTPC